MASWPDDITADLLKEISKSENIPNANAAYLVHAATYSKVTSDNNLYYTFNRMVSLDNCIKIKCAKNFNE